MPTITCCNKEFSIPYDEETNSSEYIKDIVKSFNNVGIAIPIPDKYYSVIDNYSKYVKDNKIPITSRKRLFLCFQLSTLFIDEDYFKYCVQQVFNDWSYMCVIVYNTFNDDLQWSFFVHSPYDFIPKLLLDNEVFMKLWNETNQNIITNVNNGNEIYYSNVVTMSVSNSKHITTYHTVNDNSSHKRVKEVGYMREIVYYPANINIMTDNSYIDHIQTGVSRIWFNNEHNTLKSEEYYVNGKRDGITKEWYDNDQHSLMFESHYVNGVLHGAWTQWYDTQREINVQQTLKSERYYVDGKPNGWCRQWYNTQREINTQHTEGIPQTAGMSNRENTDSYPTEITMRVMASTSETSEREDLRCACFHTLKTEVYYINYKLNGVWREWYDNIQHTLELESHYVNGVLHGAWTQWYNNEQHTIESECQYDNEKPVGLWRMWYDDEGHTLKSEENFVDGKRHGSRIEYDPNGNITFDEQYLHGIKQ